MTDVRPTDPTKPLAGRSVIVTRTREQAASLADLLEALGADVIAMPVIEIIDPVDWSGVDIAIARLSDYDWVVLTSTNGVDRFFARVREHGLEPAERLASAGVRVAAVGSATAARLATQGVRSDIVPASGDYRAEGLIDAFRELCACHEGAPGRRWRVLIPRAMEARQILPESLRELGCEVDVIPVYRTIAATPDPSTVQRLKSGVVDAIAFTSGSTVRNFLDLLEKQGLDPREIMDCLVVASIGPVTTEALRKRGFEPSIEAAEATVPALAAAMGEYFGTLG